MHLRYICIFALLLFTQIPALSQEISINFQPVPGQPYYQTTDIMVDAEEYKTVILRLKSKQSGTTRLFWASSYDMQFNQPKSISFTLRSGEHKYYFNVSSQNKYWLGWIRKLLIFPENNAKEFSIISAKILKGSIFTTMVSGWQEFFAFEAYQLRTVNFIYGPKLYGRSVNLYIYYLIIFLSIFFIARNFIKSRNLNLAIKTSAKNIVIICLVFWIILDLRILIDQARTVTADTKTFSGKSLEEKRAIITLGGFYKFIKFAQLKLPEGAGFSLLHPQGYYYVSKANYYLYPRHHEEKADYILVYNPTRSLDKQINDYLSKGYKRFATHKKGEFILKK